MAKKWYVVHVFSGSEKKVCQNIEEQIVTKDMGSLIEEVLVPTEEVVEIRRGAMERSQGLNLVRLYDGSYPSNFIEKYLDYYKMSKQDFDEILDKWANKDILRKVDGVWVPNFEIV